MKVLFWIVGVPLLLLAGLFAINNRELVTVSLWPLADPIEVRLFVAIVAPLYAGVLIGAAAAWWSGRHARSRAREQSRRAASLERDNAALKARLAALEAPSAAARPIAGPTGHAVQSAAAVPPSFTP